MSPWKIESREEVKARTSSVMVYAESGKGKTFLCFSVVLCETILGKPVHALLIDMERHSLPDALVDVLYDGGLEIAHADTPDDLIANLMARNIKDYNFIAIDGLTAMNDKNVVDKTETTKSGAPDTLRAYGTNLLSNVTLGLTTLKGLKVPVVITALEQWDRMFAGQGLKGADGKLTETAPTHMKFMPEVPGSLKQKAPAFMADAYGRLVIEGVGEQMKRRLLFSPNEYRMSKSNGLPDMTDPTMYQLLMAQGWDVTAKLSKAEMLTEMKRWSKIAEVNK